MTVRNAAKCLKDETLLAKSGSYEFGNGPDFAAKEAKYHHVYKREFTNKARDAKNSENSNLSSEKKAKSTALMTSLHLLISVLSSYVNEVSFKPLYFF